MALSLVVNYEEGGEGCVRDGDESSEALNSDVAGAQPRRGRRNLAVAHYEYGSRVGHWRILDLLHVQAVRPHSAALSRASRQ